MRPHAKPPALTLYLSEMVIENSSQIKSDFKLGQALSRVSGPTKIVTCEESLRFLSFFDMLCKIVYSFEWAKTNKLALPSGALERPFGPICTILAHLLVGARWKCELTIVHNISKHERNRSDSSQVMAIWKHVRTP